VTAPARPMTPDELRELGEFLSATPDAMPLPKAHGLLTAILSAPGRVPTGDWQPMLLGDAAFESREHAERIIGLVMQLYNQTLGELNEGEMITLPDVDSDEAIALWCSGYLEGTHLDDQWATDDRGIMMLLPLGALSGEFDLTGQQDADGKVIDDPRPHLERYRANLPAYVLELFDYWADRRRPAAPPRAPRVGRNDPCPCGSGLKYKRCCGQSVN